MFNHERLEMARKRRALTMKELADRCSVSTRTMSAWEKGVSSPRAPARRTLASVLDFPESFFLLPAPPVLTVESVSFRALTSITARERDQALSAGKQAFELSDWLFDQFVGPEVDIPSASYVSPQAAAEVVRQAWALSDKPIKNVIHLLESRGVRVFSLVEGTRRLDAFATWHDHAPFAFLNTSKSAERGRFDLAHELGHLTMHKSVETIRHRDFEIEADRFAGAFLMPGTGVFARAPRRITMDFVLTEKHHWGVPAISYVHRLHELGLLSEWHYRSFCIELTKMGFRLEEPDGVLNESSLLLAKIFGMLRPRRGMGEDSLPEGFAEGEVDQLVFGLLLRSLTGAGVQSERQKGHLRMIGS